MPARIQLFFWLAPLALCACSDFESRELVIDLRPLAVQAEPPEVFLTVTEANIEAKQVLSYTVVEDPAPVELSFLVVNPRAPETPAVWTVEACLVTFDRRCQSSAGLRVPVTQGMGRLEDIAFTFRPDADTLNAWVAEDDLFGFGGLFVMLDVEIEQPGEPRAHLSKIVTYDVPYVPDDADEEDEAPEKTPNENPELFALRIDERESRAADDVIEVRPGQKVELEPLFLRDTMIERFVEPTFSSGAGEFGWTELEEKLDFEYYVTDGDVEEATQASRSPAGDIEDLSNEFTAPDAADGPITMWVVIRDDRGGSSWIRRFFRLNPDAPPIDDQ